MRKFFYISFLIFISAGCGWFDNNSNPDASPNASTNNSCPIPTPSSVVNIANSPCAMNVGDIMPFDFNSSDVNTIDLSCANTCDRYILAIASYDTDLRHPDASINIEVEPYSPSKTVSTNDFEFSKNEDVSDGDGFDYSFHEFLREQEQRISHANHMTKIYKALDEIPQSEPPQLGQTETFWMVENFFEWPYEYIEVVGEVRFIGDAIACYFDVNISKSYITDEDVSELCSRFDKAAIYQQHFNGEVPDINGDGRLSVLITPQINKMSDPLIGKVVGYFNDTDFLPQWGFSTSNERDILYIISPDPEGQYGVEKYPMDRVLEETPAIFAHEYQHAINYYQRVFINLGHREEAWLNEAMSQLMEDMIGYGYGNRGRSKAYLSYTQSYELVRNSRMSTSNYGAVYLFLRFLYEQAQDGSAFMRSLITNEETGVDNIVEVASNYTDMKSFDEIIRRWMIALAMTDRAITTDSRYIYKPQEVNGDTGNPVGVCLTCDNPAYDGHVLRGRNVIAMEGLASNETIELGPTTIKYFNITNAPASIKLSANPDDMLTGVLIRY